jgi:hypothetical protein
MEMPLTQSQTDYGHRPCQQQLLQWCDIVLSNKEQQLHFICLGFSANNSAPLISCTAVVITPFSLSGTEFNITLLVFTSTYEV